MIFLKKPVYLLLCAIVLQSTSACIVNPESETGVPNDCMDCICQVESNQGGSNCVIPDPLCKGDGDSESCGPYQIKKAYYNDAQQEADDLGTGWKNCAETIECSARCVQGYMALYGTRSSIGHDPTCEDFARIHDGGPNGYNNEDTLEYWNKVKECLDKR